MAGIEKIATSNNEQQEAPKNAKLTKTEVSDKVDYSLDKIDEEKFNEFKKMADYIKENGKDYGDEYKNIVDKAITPFEEKISKILNKEKLKKNNIDVNSMSDEELQNEADKRLELQPEELDGQREILKKINNNGSSEEIQELNEIVNNNMADVQNLYNKIVGWAQKNNTTYNLFDDFHLDAEVAKDAA